MMVEIALPSVNARLCVDEHGTFHLTWMPGATISAADAEAVISAARSLGGTTLQPIIVELAEVNVSAEARSRLQTEHFVSAVALVGASVVDRVLSAALLRNQKCPTRYFTSVAEAREWLSALPATDTLAESVG